MIRSVTIVLLTAATAWSAPVPKGPPPDPFGNGYLGVWKNTDDELRIDRVEPNGPAQKAGLQAGDQFYEIGTTQPKTFDDIREVIGSLRPGSRVPVVVKRGEKKISVVIVLGERPENLNQQRPILYPEP
ncbi:PDZ domain-containing protein [Limnoglobus roseus]|uniref:PDZ domain-containing protein n=1 Tax=Limnoglobus roseus TaxID=2598579 RepID=A0A5C1A723_9BACT|nr:PDZ domain-containing protein [Limnoglobus roseus]QEL14205.1 PDZ domain-containing protein [Limnoglobus roseus]